MEVVETDDRLPSMRVETEISVSQFQHTLSYKGAFWIECGAWSRFAKALGSLPKGSAMLADMSGYFTLKLYEQAGKLRLSWAFRKEDVAGAMTAMSTVSAEMDDSMLARMRSEFSDFPVWWQADC
jgi:hypothetical protein